MGAIDLGSRILDLIFPKHCLGCGQEGLFLCEICGLGIPFRHPACPRCSQWNPDGKLCSPCARATGLRRFLAPFSYREPVARELIHVYKYEGVREIGPILAQYAVSYLRHFGLTLPQESILVPIPLHPRRERERGFNQATIIAESIGATLGLPVLAAIRRVRRTAPQIGLDAPALRRANVARAFSITTPALIVGKRIILVDDVSTSGATLSEAARTLREAGAKTVSALVIAKG
jgi:ComF family protein